ncbi:MAG: sigma-54 dependent transcriptional regulator [Thermodesulfobacteriota bacterium]
MKTIMVIDDEKDIRDSLEGVLKDEGYRVIVEENAEEGLKSIERKVPDLILLDIWMPGMDGVETLKEIKKTYNNLPVIMISGHATIDTAVKATKLGAYDFIEKPLSLDNIILSVAHALERAGLLEENIALRERERTDYSLIGESVAMAALKKDIGQVAPTDSWVLITGENGTGKEFVARNIHLSSMRVSKPFVEVNCAAIPEELIESELFGHEKGAFTGAIAAKKGKFDQADKGTIFLDEIADMSLMTQAKILRILQEQSFERVGGSERIIVDVRVIAATNKDLTKEIEKGRFREDLFYRLNVIPFHVLPLRERKDDIPLFVDFYLKDFSRRTIRELPTIDSKALKALVSYEWPGNVRELKNLIERLIIMGPSASIELGDIPDYIRETELMEMDLSEDNSNFKEARAVFERQFIIRKLEEFDGNITKTAEAIGLERSHLYRKIKAYKIGA